MQRIHRVFISHKSLKSEHFLPSALNLCLLIHNEHGLNHTAFQLLVQLNHFDWDYLLVRHLEKFKLYDQHIRDRPKVDRPEVVIYRLCHIH